MRSLPAVQWKTAGNEPGAARISSTDTNDGPASRTMSRYWRAEQARLLVERVGVGQLLDDGEVMERHRVRVDVDSDRARAPRPSAGRSRCGYRGRASWRSRPRSGRPGRRPGTTCASVCACRRRPRSRRGRGSSPRPREGSAGPGPAPAASAAAVTRPACPTWGTSATGQSRRAGRRRPWCGCAARARCPGAPWTASTGAKG